MRWLMLSVMLLSLSSYASTLKDLPLGEFVEAPLISAENYKLIVEEKPKSMKATLALRPKTFSVSVFEVSTKRTVYSVDREVRYEDNPDARAKALGDTAQDVWLAYLDVRRIRRRLPEPR